MKLGTKILLITGSAIIINNIIRLGRRPTSIGGYDSTAELVKIWGGRVLYSTVPGLGLATAILNSAKNLYTMKGIY